MVRLIPNFFKNPRFALINASVPNSSFYQNKSSKDRRLELVHTLQMTPAETKSLSSNSVHINQLNVPCDEVQFRRLVGKILDAKVAMPAPVQQKESPKVEKAIKVAEKKVSKDVATAVPDTKTIAPPKAKVKMVTSQTQTELPESNNKPQTLAQVVAAVVEPEQKQKLPEAPAETSCEQRRVAGSGEFLDDFVGVPLSRRKRK